MTVHRDLKKTLIISIQFIAALAALGIVVGSMLRGGFTLRFMFPAVFVAGSGMIVVGTIVLLLPSSTGRKNSADAIWGKTTSRLIDHTTYAQRLAEGREKKRILGLRIIGQGTCILVVAAVIQLVLALLL